MTRADFYVGKGLLAEWIGSIAFDGYRDGIPNQILHCQSEAAYRHAVADELKGRDDATLPSQGWPWPWDTSEVTDCCYFHFDGKTWDSVADYSAENWMDLPSKHFYAPCDQPEFNDEDDDYLEKLKGLVLIEYPNMASKKNVARGQRSGLITISA